VAQAFHWVIVLLVLAQFVIGVDAHGMPVSLLRLKLLTLHKSIGVTVFGLVVLRLLWRWYSPPPPLPANMHAWQRLAAHLSHGLLYGLLLVLPLIGWITSSASNLTVRWFFLFNLPNPVNPDPALASFAKGLHMTLAWLLLALVCLHVAAAFWHELRLKDGVLRRMLPFTSEE
jgi:cytochrome b561